MYAVSMLKDTFTRTVDDAAAHAASVAPEWWGTEDRPTRFDAEIYFQPTTGPLPSLDAMALGMTLGAPVTEVRPGIFRVDADPTTVTAPTGRYEARTVDGVLWVRALAPVTDAFASDGTRDDDRPF